MCTSDNCAFDRMGPSRIQPALSLGTTATTIAAVDAAALGVKKHQRSNRVIQEEPCKITSLKFTSKSKQSEYQLSFHTIPKALHTTHLQET